MTIVEVRIQGYLQSPNPADMNKLPAHFDRSNTPVKEQMHFVKRIPAVHSQSHSTARRMV